MSDIVLPLTAVQILARLAGLPAADAQAALLLVADKSTMPGLALLSAQSIGQAQAIIGIRRPFNPYAY